MRIEHISVSRKNVFDTCHQQYKYQYHLKLPSSVEEPFYFIYGKIIHKIGELLIESHGEKTLSEITKSIITGKIPMDQAENGDPVFAPAIPTEYKKRMPEHLRNLQKITKQLGMDGMVEYKFRYDLDPPHGRYIVGFIDRIIQKGNQFFIIDYKTSKKGFYRKTAQNITKDLQLRTYAAVVQKEFNVPASNIRAALYYLEGNELVGSKFCDQSLRAAEAELLWTYKQIEEMPEDKVVGSLGDWCNRCMHRKICPFFRMT